MDNNCERPIIRKTSVDLGKGEAWALNTIASRESSFPAKSAVFLLVAGAVIFKRFGNARDIRIALHCAKRSIEREDLTDIELHEGINKLGYDFIGQSRISNMIAKHFWLSIPPILISAGYLLGESLDIIIYNGDISYVPITISILTLAVSGRLLVTSKRDYREIIPEGKEDM